MKKDIKYNTIISKSTYCPWNFDEDFNIVFKQIKRFTLIDEFRLFELWKLVEQSAKLDSGYLIEIGVWRGGSGALIAAQAKRCNIYHRVLLCDTFKGVVKAGANDSVYKNGEHANTSEDLVKDLLLSLNLGNADILTGIFPEDTGYIIENLNFRFCHIDVDVYQSAKDIIDWIWDKMLVGGIIVYDDYGFKGCDGITKHVDEQMLLKDRIIIHNLNGHAIITKIK